MAEQGAKKDARGKSLLQEDHMTETKKSCSPSAWQAQHFVWAPLCQGKDLSLVSSPSAPCPGSCNLESWVCSSGCLQRGRRHPGIQEIREPARFGVLTHAALPLPSPWPGLLHILLGNSTG